MRAGRAVSSVIAPPEFVTLMLVTIALETVDGIALASRLERLALETG